MASRSQAGLGACRYCPLCRRNDVNEIHVLRCRNIDRGVAHKVTPLHTVVWLIKMLGGHVHGECVAMMVARDNTTSSMCTFKEGKDGGTLIECSLFPVLIPNFFEFLKDYDFNVTHHTEINHTEEVINDCLITTAPMPITPMSVGTRVVQVTHKHAPTPATATTLTVLIVPYVTSTYPVHAINTSAQCVFDMQLMSSSQSRIYVRSRQGERVGDLGVQLRRAQLRQFALLPRGCAPIASDQAVFMCFAMRMLLERGWHMDDSVVGRVGWVVARWSVMETAPRCIRIRSDDAGGAWGAGGAGEDALTMHNECPICFAEFLPDDIVVNLPCNHNIHATCDMANNNSGMCMWLVTGKNPTCPCCRANIVRGHA